MTLTGDRTITITDTGYYVASVGYFADVRAISNATVDAGGAGPIKINITAKPKSSTSVDSSSGTIQAIYAEEGAATIVRGDVELNIEAQGGTSISKDGYANSYSSVRGLYTASGRNVLGGNAQLSKRSYLYGDIASATIQKKWQLNAGVRVDF